MGTCTPANSGDSCSCECRRGFLNGLLAIGLGAIAYATPIVVGVISYLNPLRQKGRAGQFLQLAQLDALPEDGTPRKVPVVLDRQDGWTHFPPAPVGAVFLRRVGAKKDKVEAIQVVCPHAGCFVSYDDQNKQFFCPCHSAHFDLEGHRTDAVSPSPRDLDTLDVEIREGGQVWVMFQNFCNGKSEKVAQA